MKKGLTALITFLLVSGANAETLYVSNGGIQKKLEIVNEKEGKGFKVLKGCMEQMGRTVCFPIMKVGDYYGFLVFKREGNKLVPAFNEFKEIKKLKINVGKLNKEVPDYLVLNKGGNRKVYIFVDLMCPFCAERGVQKLKEFKEKGYEVHIIPFPVHGRVSEKSWACALAEMDKGEEADKVLSKYFEIFKTSKTLKEYEDRVDKACPSNWRGYLEEVRKIKELSREAGVRYVPFIGKEVEKDTVEEVR